MTTSLPDVYSMPLDAIDVSDPKIYQDDVWQPYFESLRQEAPVHYCRESRYGPYWSVCKYNDIMQVEINHRVYSSERGGIAVEDPPKVSSGRALSAWTRPNTTSSARWSARSLPRRILPRWRQQSANGRSGGSTPCRRTKPS